MKHKKRTPMHPLELRQEEYCLVGDKKKRKYPTQFDAELSAPTPDLTQYACEYCGFWHNGKSDRIVGK